MRKKGPTFLIAGAPRSGTTWLYHLLDRHPEVYMAKPVRPEPKFFLVDELYERGLQHYIDTWFAGSDAHASADIHPQASADDSAPRSPINDR